MNTMIKLSVASALAFGAVAAHASIAVPSTGASDAILFAEVVNSSGSAVASYAGDTGVSINTLLGGLSGSTTVLGSDANLAKLFAADASGDSIVWAVEGGQYTQSNSTTNWKNAGVAQFLTTVSGNDTASKLANDNTANLVHWATLSQDVTQINTNSGGANSVEGPVPATAGVWDAVNPTTTSSGWYGNGPVTSNTTGGGAENLYYVTGGGSTGAKVAFSSIATASLSASGLTLSGAGSPPPVPLPPAVWLLGSGLLGLAGVARRKSKV